TWARSPKRSPMPRLRWRARATSRRCRRRRCSSTCARWLRPSPCRDTSNARRLCSKKRLPCKAWTSSRQPSGSRCTPAWRERPSEALALARRVYLPDHPARASLLDLHGIILTHLARFDEAVEAITESIAIREASRSQGSSLAAAYNNLALALDNAERDAEAEPHMIRAMELAGEVFGRDDPRYAIAVANLGNLYRQSGRHDEAEALLDQGLRMRREMLGPDHPYVAIGLV